MEEEIYHIYQSITDLKKPIQSNTCPKGNEDKYYIHLLHQLFSSNDPVPQHHFPILLPHVRRACQIRSSLLRKQAGFEASILAINQLSTSVFVIDSKMNIIYASHDTFDDTHSELADNSVQKMNSLERLFSDELQITIESLRKRNQLNDTSHVHASVIPVEEAQYLLRISQLKTNLPAHNRFLDTLNLATYKYDGIFVLTLTNLATFHQENPTTVFKPFGLSPTELEITRLLINGKSPRGIAEIRSRSIGTIRCQIKHILAKTGFHKTTELIAHFSALGQMQA